MPFHSSSNNISMDEMSDEDGISLATEGEGSSFGEEEELAELENRAVSCLRASAFSVMGVAAILVAFLVHQSSSRAETLNFHQAYQAASSQVIESIQSSLHRAVGALESLAVDYESYAKQSQDVKWPFVTLPDFERRSQSTRELSESQLLMLLPFVNSTTQSTWEHYSVQNLAWLQHNRTHHSGLSRPLSGGELVVAATERSLKQGSVSPFIFNETGRCTGNDLYNPLWQTTPQVVGLSHWVNFDLLSVTPLRESIPTLQECRSPILGGVVTGDNRTSTTWINFLKLMSITGPTSPILYPIYSDGSVVASLVAMNPWEMYLSRILSPSIVGLTVVVQSGSNQSVTFEINGGIARYIGSADLHETKYDGMGKTVSLHNNSNNAELGTLMNARRDLGGSYSLSVYPSETMRRSFEPWNPVINTVIVSLIFMFASFVFILYDALVERRQKIVMNRALQSTAIVSSLFPETVRDRLFRRGSVSEHGGDDGSLTVDDVLPVNQSDAMMPLMAVQPAKMRLKSFLTEADDAIAGVAAKPIADLFPRCTVLFADISGFTAWSSLRDPAQVFTLLESVYQSFDRIARKRGVFKVETIGDSYVAVTGLPEPQDDHAVIMARFARDCKIKMNDVTRKLELTLGPDTADLRMRFGLHSGPVTAGVLRGEKSRFQLFGDTVNTAARMESTGMRDKIQLSQATADALVEAGKGHWLVKRDTKVVAKGKGEMQTYWLDDSFRTRRQSTGENSRCSVSSVESGRTFENGADQQSQDKSVIWGSDEEIPEVVSQRTKHQRLIDYNVDLLACRLKHVIARRKVLEMAGRRCSQGGLPPNMESYRESKIENGNVLEEVTEVIKLPSFNSKAYKGNVDPDSIEISPEVMSQLRRYVTIIAAMYRNNPFHNFEHASHVTMSVNKLLHRVVAPEITFKRRSLQMDGNSLKKQIASDLHNYTYGITSDPLTQFAVVFSALIHDCDHWGVSNDQLVREGVPIAEKYNNKSIAEQNSVDLAWDLLMDEDEYGALQQCIFPTDAELKRFRQVVVNTVMATDIFDRELCEMRNNRWSKAFAEKEPGAPPDLDDENRKATIVIEHLMQASDVAHTMQHWHVYQKWNRRLFDELYTAFRANRMERDPSDFWYQSELKFFDGYIIPLAKKLKDCGVFGVSSDECLNYAMDNRREWESKGQMIVSELVANYQQREREEAEAMVQASAAASAPKNKKRGRMSRRRSLITTGG